VKNIESLPRYRAWLLALVLASLAAACGKDQILGNAGLAALAPTVSSVTPAAGASGVVPTRPGITATLSEAVGTFTGGASLTVTCAAPCVNPVGTVTLDATHKIATYAVTTGSLAALTPYTATLTGVVSLANGLTLETPYVWHFTTGAIPVAPTVSAVTPIDNAAAVPINTSLAVTFSEPIAPLTGTASFTVACAAASAPNAVRSAAKLAPSARATPCTSPAGTVTLDAAGVNATFTPAADLAPLTTYTATITGAVGLASNLPLTSPYVWQFTTGLAADTTRPTVLLTDPATTSPGPTAGAPVNAAITAAFSTAMAPATIGATSFTVTCTAPCISPAGAVSYQGGDQTAVFTPTAPLTVGTTYSATLTTAVTDLAGNALAGNQAPLPAASNYVWRFTTSAAAPAENVAVSATNPTAAQSGVCPNASVNATFNVPSGLRMNPTTVTAATFTLVGPSPAQSSVTAASVALDAATGRIATLTPQKALTSGGLYTATISGGPAGVKDLAVPGNELQSNFVWNFTVGPATGNCLAPVALGTASQFGNFAGNAGSTNTGTLTVINGDIGTIATGTSLVTGFNDTAGDIYTETGANVGNVNGTIFTCTVSTTGPTSAAPNVANCSVAQQALADATTAYLAMKGMPAGTNPGSNLGSLTLGPGVYTAPANTFAIQGGNLTLNAGGNVNAVWVFQMASSLTVGGPGVAFPQSVILAGGAQAKNVFWQVGSAATINAAGGGTMVGTIIAMTGAVVSTAGNVSIVTINGRLMSLGPAVTLVDTVINVPGP
jgi:hypothetical protein